jgi:hypothetical protein
MEAPAAWRVLDRGFRIGGCCRLADEDSLLIGGYGTVNGFAGNDQYFAIDLAQT